MEEKIPRTRDDIELYPLRHEGKQMVMVRDPLGLIKEPVVLNEVAASVLTMLDGSHTLSDLRLHLTRNQGGLLVTTDQVGLILEQLSSAFLLQDERFEKARAEIVAGYAALPVRKAFHAGVSYPNDAKALALMLDEILESGEPGMDIVRSDVVALVAPHIELKTAAGCYGAAYGQINGLDVDLVVILGTGHSVRSAKFCLTTKDFETPLGTLPTDKDIVERLAESSADCLLDNDLPHRHEHSIDFQTIFLKHVLPGKNVRIVPILCGSFRTLLEAHGRASEAPCIGDFLSKLRSVIEEHSGRCLIVAGVDFSHVGHKFGDQYTGRSLAQESEPHDRALIEHLVAWKPEGFWNEAKEKRDAYKVCGFAPLASMLEILPEATGHLLGYEIWHEDATRSAVSFASIVFTKS
jgi:AmmeMemoRadiSam system protein B